MRTSTILLFIVLFLSVRCGDTSGWKLISKDIPRQINSPTLIQQQSDSCINDIKCSLDIILQTEHKMDSLKLKDLITFLKIFSKDCRNNVEFSEVSNEVLFIVIEKHPELFVDAMCSNNEKIEFKEIYLQLSSPLHDLIPVDSIYKRINGLSRDCSRLDSIKKYLGIAVENI